MFSASKNIPRCLAPLRRLLIVPFVALLASSVALTGYLSFRNGKSAVNAVVLQLRSQLATGIEGHLSDFLDQPHKINHLNADALQQGRLDAGNVTALEHHFWKQVQVFDWDSSWSIPVCWWQLQTTRRHL
jgi:hypothetical protein